MHTFEMNRWCPILPPTLTRTLPGRPRHYIYLWGQALTDIDHEILTWNPSIYPFRMRDLHLSIVASFLAFLWNTTSYSYVGA